MLANIFILIGVGLFATGLIITLIDGKASPYSYAFPCLALIPLFLSMLFAKLEEDKIMESE